MATCSHTMPTATACYSTVPKRRRTAVQAPWSHDARFRREARRAAVGAAFEHHPFTPERHTGDHRGVGSVLWIDSADKVLGGPGHHATGDSPLPLRTSDVCDVFGRAPRGGLRGQSR